MQRKYWAYHLCQGLGLTGSLLYKASLVAQLVKNLPAMWETWVRSLEGKGYLFQGSGLKNSMDYIAHGVAKSWTQVRNLGEKKKDPYDSDNTGHHTPQLQNNLVSESAHATSKARQGLTMSPV